MALSPVSWLRLKALKDDVRDLIQTADDGELVDVLAEVRETEKNISSQRRMAMAEVPAGSQGAEWWVSQGRQAARSYNDSQILLKIAAAWDVSPLEAIGRLMNNGTMTLAWKWQPKKGQGLKELIQELDLEITTKQHEIEAGDSADIGEIWKDNSPEFKRLADRKIPDA